MAQWTKRDHGQAWLYAGAWMLVMGGMEALKVLRNTGSFQGFFSAELPTLIFIAITGICMGYATVAGERYRRAHSAQDIQRLKRRLYLFSGIAAIAICIALIVFFS